VLTVVAHPKLIMLKLCFLNWCLILIFSTLSNFSEVRVPRTMVRAGVSGGFTKARSKFARVQNPDMADSDLSDVDADDEEALRAKVARGGEDDDDVRPSHRPCVLTSLESTGQLGGGSTPQGARAGMRVGVIAAWWSGYDGGQHRRRRAVHTRRSYVVRAGGRRPAQSAPAQTLRQIKRGMWGGRALRWSSTTVARVDRCTRRVCTLQRCNRPAAASGLTSRPLGFGDPSHGRREAAAEGGDEGGNG
jgi:hypothetical protein